MDVLLFLCLLSLLGFLAACILVLLMPKLSGLVSVLSALTLFVLLAGFPDGSVFSRWLCCGWLVRQ